MVVLGPMISDNSVNLRDLVNETGVAVHRLDRLRPVRRRVLLHGRQRRHPHRVALWARSGASRTATRRSASSGSSARRAPTTATGSGTAAQPRPRDRRHRAPARPNPVGIAGEPGHDARPRRGRRSSTWATGTPRSTSSAAFKALGWDPPRFMGTAFMFYSNTNEWAEGLEGWHGVDQLGEDGMNPNYDAMMERFEKRFGHTVRQRRRRAGVRHRARRRSTASRNARSRPRRK